jgi:hypothetical protein
LTEPALDIHLYCQHAAAESKAIVEILDGFIATPSSSGQVGIFVEMEVRRGNAVGELKGLARAIEHLATVESNPPLSLREMSKRTLRTAAKMEGLKGVIDELEKMVQGY